MAELCIIGICNNEENFQFNDSIRNLYLIVNGIEPSKDIQLLESNIYINFRDKKKFKQLFNIGISLFKESNCTHVIFLDNRYSYQKHLISTFKDSICDFTYSAFQINKKVISLDCKTLKKLFYQEHDIHNYESIIPCMWSRKAIEILGNMKTTLFDYMKNTFEYIQDINFIDKVTLISEIHKPFDIIYITNTRYRRQINRNNKENWRSFCWYNLQYLELFEASDNVKMKSSFNAVLIEFRPLINLEFVIKNCMIKLGDKFCYTVICGHQNYQLMKSINLRLKGKLNIIKYDVYNITFDEYNNLLYSKEFWESLDGEKILIYQEDSCIFKTNIMEFKDFDFIGAPWPKRQAENPHNVGNGGLSLRTKSKILQVINTSIDIEKIRISKNTYEYMKNTGLKNIPEDIYYCNSLIYYNIGTVADFDTAKEFSQELIYSNDPFGGHNWWLHAERSFSISDYNFDLDFTRIFNNCVGIASPYKYTLGGGEKYLSHIIKFFISLKYIIYFFNPSSSDEIMKTCKLYLTEDEIRFIKPIEWKFIFNNNLKKKMKLDYFVSMHNLGIPECKGLGKINIYHCQFPCDVDLISLETVFYKDWSREYIISVINSYQIKIVNSEFTRDSLVKLYQKYNINPEINIIYPPCFIEINSKSYTKTDNSFVMIGRIFPWDRYANNKYFDLAIKIFNRFHRYNFTLTIIGSVKDIEYYNLLTNLITTNKIKIVTDITDAEKNKILSETKYFVQLTGINDNSLFNKEHFGISLMEALNFNCIPICFKGGYPGYFLKHMINGYLINDESHLHKVITMLLTEFSTIPKYNYHLEKFKYSEFHKKMKELFSNNKII